MDFDLAPEHELIRDTVREFARERVAPLAAELDLEARFPYDLDAELAGLGLMGMPIPEEYGGGGTDTPVRDRDRGADAGGLLRRDHGRRPHLARRCRSSCSERGAEAEWLPDLASGRRLATFGLTERAPARRGRRAHDGQLRDGNWVVNGSRFITNMSTDITACVTITARTGPDEISNIVVPNGTPG